MKRTARMLVVAVLVGSFVSISALRPAAARPFIAPNTMWMQPAAHLAVLPPVILLYPHVVQPYYDTDANSVASQFASAPAVLDVHIHTLPINVLKPADTLGNDSLRRLIAPERPFLLSGERL